LSQRIVFHEDDVGLMRRVLPTFPGGESVSIACGADGNVTLAGRDRETGDETRLPLQGSRYTGPGSRICLDRVFLQEAFDAGFRAFGFADSHAPLMAEDGQGGTHVLMPLRVTGEPRPVQSQEPAAPEAASETPIQQPETAQPQETAQPEPEHPKENPKMNHENQTRTTTPTQANVQEPTALEKLQAAYETARNKVREAQSALADVAIAIRDAAREDRQRRSEVESVRAGLQKLQAIRV
jgi:pyruvate/2-oxoglutarate dehydrogenase complex dihydrolipoamide acyltransferase (E2) component